MDTPDPDGFFATTLEHGIERRAERFDAVTLVVLEDGAVHTEHIAEARLIGGRPGADPQPRDLTSRSRPSR